MSILTGPTGSIIQAFSWMLVHSLWQGALLAFVAGIVLMLTKKVGAAVRYNLVLALFAVFLVTAAFTFAYEYNHVRPEITPYSGAAHIQAVNKVLNSNSRIYASTRIVSITPVTKTYLSASNINVLIKVFSNYFSEHSFLIVMLWFIFFMAKSVSMAGNMLYMHRAKHYRVYAPSDHWKERVASLCQKLQLKRAVLLLESGYIKVPVVIGYFKPVILVPVGLIAGIPAEQVEAVLLHELAHIRRNDYAVNFMQSITEAVFFFNPGLLWVSKLLREERENCCDDIAIAQTNNKEEFVQALISFKDYSVSMPAYAVAFSGQKSSLLNRVMRIVYQENKTLSIKENGIFIAGIAMLLLMAFTIYPVKDAKWVKAHYSISKSNNSNIKALSKKPLKGTNEINAGVSTNKLIATHAPLTNVPDAVGLVKEELVTNKIMADPLLTTLQTEQADKTIKNTSDATPDKSTFGTDEVKRLINKARLDNNKIYTRIALKDSVNDLVWVRFPGGEGMTTLHHNAKMAFIIGGILYDENGAAKFTQSQINGFDTGKNSIGGAIAFAQKRYPDLDLSKYEAYVEIGNNSDNYRPDISP